MPRIIAHKSSDVVKEAQQGCLMSLERGHTQEQYTLNQDNVEKYIGGAVDEKSNDKLSHTDTMDMISVSDEGIIIKKKEEKAGPIDDNHDNKSSTLESEALVLLADVIRAEDMLVNAGSAFDGIKAGPYPEEITCDDTDARDKSQGGESSVIKK
ncbi:hypothetical protein H2198_009971 [Neophaeococcomyces mojaviensis]|uniref:Uncharacterized protein n=1 Tax=Neophaeococcomyces mojaviensis TaxID=3383035 RepID=A0ACC2ZSV4_9EURO|nr:hypothetical protein H2198_009971 [Knufia sp. JES_112]